LALARLAQACPVDPCRKAVPRVRRVGPPLRPGIRGTARGAKCAFANQEQRFVRERRKERERPSCRAQLAALKSQFAADCEGSAEQARLYIPRLWRLLRTLMLLI